MKHNLSQTQFSQMLKTSRNIVIALMAGSGLLLCMLTMPLTLLDLIHDWWPIGSSQVP